MNDQLSIRVAWLYYLENLTQAEIGERLGLTRARVNRMLAEARESGLVRISLGALDERSRELVRVVRRPRGDGLPQKFAYAVVVVRHVLALR